MGELIVISEKGVPHAAVRVQVGDNTPQWYGFRPQIRFKVIGKGVIDTSNREKHADKIVRFDFSDDMLVQAVAKTTLKYQDAVYILFFKDCVSFVVDFLQQIQLAPNSFGNRLGFSPDKLISNLSMVTLQSDSEHVKGKRP
ncbi:MAG: hypothetical protein GY803_25565 [Chloroflexi bacterium]|nr:hypothetical protein [Chloroflexota bacterium]